MPKLDVEKLDDGRGGSGVQVDPTKTVPAIKDSVKKRLDQLVSNDIADIVWQLEATSYRAAVDKWNADAVYIDAFLKNSANAAWLNNVSSGVSAPTSAPAELNSDLLIVGIANNSWSKVESFTTTLGSNRKLFTQLKDYFEQNNPPLPPSYSSQMSTIMGDRLKIISDMNKLFNIIKPLWEEFAIGVTDAQEEAALLKFVNQSQGGAYTADDGSLVITSPNLKDLTIAQASAANWIYYVPQAKDVNNSPLLVGKYNPPPHVSTKPISPIAFQEINRGKKSGRYAIGGDLSRNTNYFKGISATNLPENRIKNQKTVANRLAFIYQDAQNANRAVKDAGVSLNLTDLWGFQFMYNPPGLQYGISADPNVDWTAFGGSNGDISTVLFGQGSYEFKTYINRQADLTILPKIYNNRTFSQTSKGYPRTLSEEEVLGIITRGTEYDIEFLYRVLNGDPQTSPTMKKGQVSSDFGLIYGLPIWIRFSDSLRFKGVITNLTVNHIIFNPDMVPMLTELSISFTRIPVITYDAEVRDSTNTILIGSVNPVGDTPETEG
jgi:hypothetical protein